MYVSFSLPWQPAEGAVWQHQAAVHEQAAGGGGQQVRRAGPGRALRGEGGHLQGDWEGDRHPDPRDVHRYRTGRHWCQGTVHLGLVFWCVTIMLGTLCLICCLTSLGSNWIYEYLIVWESFEEQCSSSGPLGFLLSDSHPDSPFFTPNLLSNFSKKK